MGVEPILPVGKRILSPLRLPFRHVRMIDNSIVYRSAFLRTIVELGKLCHRIAICRRVTMRPKRALHRERAALGLRSLAVDEALQIANRLESNCLERFDANRELIFNGREDSNVIERVPARNIAGDSVVDDARIGQPKFAQDDLFEPVGDHKSSIAR